MEDHVYNCGWKESSDGFEIWLKSQPDLRVRAETFSIAEELLRDAIADEGGAVHAVFEYVPHLPQTEFERRFSNPELYLICGDASFDIDAPRRRSVESDEQREKRELWCDGLFTVPCCRDCDRPRGPRNDRRLQLSSFDTRYDGGVSTFLSTQFFFFSERFLRLLTKEERSRIEFREVDRPSECRKPYFELVGPSGPRHIGLVDTQMSGGYCEQCGRKDFSYWDDETDIYKLVALSDLPSPLPDVFTVGVSPEVRLCVSAKRWASMVGKRGTRGMTSNLLGVIPDDLVDRDPPLTSFQQKERDWLSQRARNR